MYGLLSASGFIDVNITEKANAAEFIKDWMPGSEAEKYVTSVYVTASKSRGSWGFRDDVRLGTKIVASSAVASSEVASSEVASSEVAPSEVASSVVTPSTVAPVEAQETVLECQPKPQKSECQPKPRKPGQSKHEHVKPVGC